MGSIPILGTKPSNNFERRNWRQDLMAVANKKPPHFLFFFLEMKSHALMQQQKVVVTRRY